MITVSFADHPPVGGFLQKTRAMGGILRGPVLRPCAKNWRVSARVHGFQKMILKQILKSCSTQRNAVDNVKENRLVSEMRQIGVSASATIRSHCAICRQTGPKSCSDFAGATGIQVLRRCVILDWLPCSLTGSSSRHLSLWGRLLCFSCSPACRTDRARRMFRAITANLPARTSPRNISAVRPCFGAADGHPADHHQERPDCHMGAVAPC